MRTAFVVSALAFIAPALSAPTVVPIIKRAGPVKPNSYIVKLKDDASNETWSKLAEAMGQSGSSMTHDYRPLMNAFAGNLLGSGLSVLQNSKDVEYIEQDSIVSIDHGDDDSGFDLASSANVQPREPLAARTDAPVCDTKIVTVYGIDTGIYKEHNCFGGRAFPGFVYSGGTPGDDNGHGTHTIATAICTKYGLATSAHGIEVKGKLLGADGSGSSSDVIAGVVWAAEDFVSKNVPAVATMSLGGPIAKALDKAVEGAIGRGLHFTVAAGNSNAPADLFSPARVNEANTIGAVDSENKKASFSNFGPKLDAWAPGVNILSAWIGNPNAENTISGTSMATPHVAGILAVAICKYGNKKPEQISADLKSHAAPVVKGALLSTDLLAQPW
ncbi:unnamed protein product [Rhizoctonia solani]|uniref:Cuticle-degrading protease n=1 Tax=Rhizoctonia solani TaxID=456999 RepID=A0A8H3AZE3_9AGAM|nr:unnamed protein product [Rhizoctonia solani]